MELLRRIVIADPSEEYRKSLLESIAQEGDIQVVGATGDGQELLDLILLCQPDLVVMDMTLATMDGLDVLDAAKKLPIQHLPKVLMVSAIQGNLLDVAINRGVSFYLPKPCQPQKVCQRIRQLLGGNQEPHITTPPNLELQVATILHEIGVPAHIKGYPYMRHAIILTIQDGEMLHGVTKVLYPQVAKYYRSTPSRVERSIRHAIDLAWRRGYPDALQHYFGCTISPVRRRPTNSEFIAMLADTILLRQCAK